MNHFWGRRQLPSHLRLARLFALGGSGLLMAAIKLALASEPLQFKSGFSVRALALSGLRRESLAEPERLQQACVDLWSIGTRRPG